MREAEVEKVFREAVESVGGKCYKWVSPGNAGVPDRIVIFKNWFPIFVELKRTGEKPRKLQEKQIEILEKLGQRVHVVSGIAGVAEFFRKYRFQETAERIRKKYGI